MVHVTDCVWTRPRVTPACWSVPLCLQIEWVRSKNAHTHACMCVCVFQPYSAVGVRGQSVLTESLWVFPLLIGAGPWGGPEQRRGQSRSAVLCVTPDPCPCSTPRAQRVQVCVCVCVDLLLQQAVSKETGVWCCYPGGRPMLQEAGARLGEAFVLCNTPLEPVEPPANSRCLVCQKRKRNGQILRTCQWYRIKYSKLFL